MKAWTEFCHHLTKTLGSNACNQWLSAFKIVKFDARNLYLEARDAFAKMWFDEHVRPQTKQHLIANNGKPITVHLTVRGSLSKKAKAQPLEKPTIEYTPDLLPDHMTFEHFCGESVAKSLLSNFKPGEFNPIYIYGPPGSGKTHLLTAFAKTYPGSFLVHAETFTHHVVSAMRTSDMDTFRKTYRNIDALLIDDIHLLKKRTATQEEFFHTFNALHTAGIPIIISANGAPSSLQAIEERLISRFEWGIALPLETQTNLKEILTARLGQSQLKLTEDGQDYLLTHFANTTSISKALEALLLRTHMQNITDPLSPLKCAQILEDLLRDEKRATLAPQTILKAVADHFEISTDDLLGRSQTKTISLPRKIAMTLFRQKLKMPYTKIGDHFSRDHSTVMSSIRSIENDKTHTPDLTEINLLLT